MSQTPDPVRWIDQPDELPSELRAALINHVQRGPSSRQRAHMAERVAARVAALDTLATTEAAHLATHGSKLFSWGGGALSVGLAVIAVGWLIGSPSQRPAPSRPPATAVISQAASVVAPAPAPAAAKRLAPAAPVAEPSPVPSRSRSPLRAAARPPSTAVDPAAELRLLTPARQLVAVKPARALALADEHAQLFPSGVFAEERSVVRLEALARLGRAAEVRADARVFTQRYPRSVHAARVQELVGEQ